MSTQLGERAGLVAASATVESPASAVSWPAIFAGAFAAAAASLLLVALGSGLGLASVSAWPGHGASATTFTVLTAIWIIVVQWLASGLGGYLTGRLRTKWVGTHTHEVFFRDTAHGFATWAVATLMVAGLLGSAASSIVGTGIRAAATATSGESQAASDSGAHELTNSSRLSSSVAPYDVDLLFRSTRPDTASMADERAEATRILARAVTTGDVPATDRGYLAELVAARTGSSRDDALRRVDDVITRVKAAEVKARQAADAARKAGAQASIFTALSMLIGAFIACIAAALGGRRRDLHP